MIEELAQFISERGVYTPSGTAYLVGGNVRDELLGIPSKDVDIEVFGLSEESLEKRLRVFAESKHLSFSAVGKSFKVFKLRDSEGNEIDVSLPRRDRKVSLGHKGFEVVADPNMSLQLAARRRDFSINALYKNILTGSIIDPTEHGLEDLENKVLRMVDKNAFAEDPLRVLRGLQFACRFDSIIEYNTLQEMKKVDLCELPVERIWMEVEKALLSENPSFFFALISNLPNAIHLFPEVDRLVGVLQEPEWHPEGDVYLHTMLALDKAAKILATSEFSRPEKLTVMLAVLCHDFGKANTTEVIDERIRTIGHAKAGLEPTTALLDRLNIYTIDGFPVREQVLRLVEYHLVPPQLHAASLEVPTTNVGRTLRRLALKVRLDLLAAVSLADMLGRATDENSKQVDKNTIDWFLGEAEKSQVMNKPPEKILKGRHLLEIGMMPGPEMGQLLDYVFKCQLDGVVRNLEEAIDFAKARLQFAPSLKE
jgi:tRNA nucleotidyltransferase (CCA-adding enzyme)